MTQRSDSNEPTPLPIRPISLTPFAIQLQNIVPVDIRARRFPIDTKGNEQLNMQINITNLHIDSDDRQAQVILEVKLVPSEEPHFFEIAITLVGLFSYTVEYQINEVYQFLEQGSIGAMLPFARELVFNLSTRLQITPVMLSLIQLVLPKQGEGERESFSR